MRVLPAALAISATLHVAAYAWVRARHDEKIVAPKPPAPASPAEPPPMAVVLLDGPTPVASPPRDTAGLSHAASRISGSGRGARPEVRGPSAPPAPSEVPARRSLLSTMRPPELDKGPSQGFIDNLLSRDKPGVDPDRLRNQKWIDNATGDDVTAARLEQLAQREARDGDELHPSGGGTYRSHYEAFDANVARDGTASLKDRPDVDIHVGCLFSGCNTSFDDWAMRKAGIDPYRAAKLHWLDKTRDERAEIGLSNRKAELAQSAQLMQQNLAWMWQKTRDPDERKEALFEMWDDIAETGDEDLVDGGAAARSYLIGFIRTRLPAGSASAFTARELAELNARRHSRAVFAPYD
jgi:hypothetical protein